MVATGVLAVIASLSSTWLAIAERSVIGGLLSAIATGWAIQAALSRGTFLPALAFGIIGLLFTAIGKAVWRALEHDD